MADMKMIIEKLAASFAHPKKTVADYKAATGKGAVGMVAPYGPEELVHAAGMLPIGLWGGTVQINKARVSLPAFACSIMQSVKELECGGDYDMLEAVICSSVCDTLKAIGQKWTGKPEMIHFAHPQNRVLKGPSRIYLAKEYEYIKGRLEDITGIKITDEAIAESLKIYDEHNDTMNRFGVLAATHPDMINIKSRHIIYKSAFFMRKEDHTALVKEINDILEAAPVNTWKGTRLIVSGIMLEPDNAIEIMDDLGMAIAADDLAQESRQYRVNASTEGAPLERLADKWVNMYGCSLAYDPKKARIQMLADMVKETKADGIIIAMMKFCDPEEFDFPAIKRTMEAAEIPYIQIEIDQQMESSEQLRTRLQSFAEIIEEI